MPGKVLNHFVRVAARIGLCQAHSFSSIQSNQCGDTSFCSVLGSTFPRMPTTEFPFRVMLGTNIPMVGPKAPMSHMQTWQMWQTAGESVPCLLSRSRQQVDGENARFDSPAVESEKPAPQRNHHLPPRLHGRLFFFHLLKNIFPLLVLKGIYHNVKYFSRGLNQMEVVKNMPSDVSFGGILWV